MNRRWISFVGAAGVAGWLFLAAPSAPAEPPEIAVIRPELRTGFVNAGWKYDRYQDFPSLDANKTMPVADLKGPGIIRHIHVTRHAPKELAAWCWKFGLTTARSRPSNARWLISLATAATATAWISRLLSSSAPHGATIATSPCRSSRARGRCCAMIPIPRSGVRLIAVIPLQALLTPLRVRSRAPRFSTVTQASILRWPPSIR
jgi:hypothetical protein